MTFENSDALLPVQIEMKTVMKFKIPHQVLRRFLPFQNETFIPNTYPAFVFEAPSKMKKILGKIRLRFVILRILTTVVFVFW